jgi:glycosyltransferase involved in cell wall biosynthesis
MGRELISIIIPSLNEEAHIGTALRSIQEQDYEQVEVLVVDSFSEDRTRQIAQEYGAKVIDYPGKLLGARVEGLKAATGQRIMHIDADQVLQPRALARCAEALDQHAMVVLGERSYRPSNWVQRRLDRQRVFFESEAGRGGASYNVYPRFFRRELLEKAYAEIPAEMIPTMNSYEDSLVYSKVRGFSYDVVIVPGAVWHQEEASARELFKHHKRIGRNTRAYRDAMPTDSFHKSKSKASGMLDALVHRYLLVSVIKELGFQIGYRF